MSKKISKASLVRDLHNMTADRDMERTERQRLHDDLAKCQWELKEMTRHAQLAEQSAAVSQRELERLRGQLDEARAGAAKITAELREVITDIVQVIADS